MPAIAPQTLFAEAKCYACFGPVSEVQMLKLAYLRRILLASDPLAATDPQSLLEYGKCFPCFSTASLADIMELAILDQIAQAASGGGGGGAGSFDCGVVNPVAAPTGACGLYVNTATSSLFYWTGSIWFPLLGG